MMLSLRSRSSHGSRVWLLLTFVWALVASSSCSANKQSDNEQLAGAVDRTLSSGSALLRWTLTQGSVAIFRGEGEVDFTGERGRMEISEGMGQAAIAGELVLADGHLFSREVRRDGSWLEWTRTQGGASEFLGLVRGIPELGQSNATPRGKSDSFSQALNALVGDPRDYRHEGSRVVDDVMLERFRLTSNQLGPGETRATEVYLDSESRLRRIEFPASDPLDRAIPMISVLEFDSFGAAVEVATPVLP